MSRGAMRFKRGNKYRATKVTLDGIRFDSKREARRYQALRLAQRSGEIRNLHLQVPFECRVEGVLVCKYIADFTYERRDDDAHWSLIVEDSKGFQTPIFKLKKKLVEALYPIEIVLS